jgi:hypothetical protein
MRGTGEHYEWRFRAGVYFFLSAFLIGWQKQRRERETTPRVARLSRDLGKRVACAASTFRISH